MADCPECEYCCAIGLCCPPEQQQAKLVDMFTGDGMSEADAHKAAAVIVKARHAAQKHGA